MGIDDVFLMLKGHAGSQHEKHLVGTCRSVGEDVALEIITQHLRKALYVDDDLRLVGQDGTVQVFHDGADTIEQRTVGGVIMANAHMAVAHYLQRFANRILIAKESLGQPFGDDTFVWRIECRPSVALQQLEVEEAEEHRVGQHDDAVLVFTVLHLLLSVFYLSALAHHAAGLFHLWTQILNVLSLLRPHKEKTLVAHQVDAVGILMPRIDAILPPRIVTHQDDEHQRHHQTRYINKGIGLVTR